ncbi:MAG: hypothetical protein H7Y28_14905 [Rhodoferax sp.]|nr:hypothetical protein [Rhodoferax sp.]
MIDPLAAFSLPRQRMSMQALVTVGALHVALLWLMLQSGPAVKATRQVVMQYFSPITQVREKPVPKPVLAVTPAPKPIPVVPPPPPRVETPPPPMEQAPVPVIQRMEAVTPQRATVKIQDIKPSIDTRRVPDLSSTRIEPVLAPVPVLPTPEPVPVPKSAPIPEPAPPPVQTPPPAPAPEPVVPPAPAPAPPPVAVPAPAPTPALPPAAVAAPARATAITPVETRAAPASTAGGAGSASPSLALPLPGAAPGGSGLNLNYNYKPSSSGRQKTAAEMANEQLNGTGRKDKLADSVNAAEKPDCINSGQALGLLAPVLVIANVVRDKCK